MNPFHVVQTVWSQLHDAPIAANLFTLGAVVLWVLTARAASARGQHQMFALIIATIFCLSCEMIAIQLGKYHYAPFALALPEIPICGLEPLLEKFGGRWGIPEIIKVPATVSKHVPVEVALLEGALVFSLFRITNLLSPQVFRGAFSLSTIVPWLRARWPNPVLNGFLALSLDAMLDPIVSNTVVANPTSMSVPVGFGLWTWHTTSHYAGHWFGIPLANYHAWYGALIAFTFATRFGSTEVTFGSSRFQRGKARLLAICGSLALLLVLAFAVKLVLDWVAYDFKLGGLLKSPLPKPGQLAIVGMLIVAGIAAGVVISRRAIRDAAFEWVTVAPFGFVYLYCAGALVFARQAEPIGWLTLLWIVSALVAYTHVKAPWRPKQPAAVQRTMGAR